MAQKRVFIVSQYPLFDAALQTAIGHQPEIELVGVCRDGLESAYAQTQTLRPDIVLLIAGPEVTRRSALRLVEESAHALIWIDVTDGLMHVYRREEISRPTVDDLMQAIQIAREALGGYESSDMSDEPDESRTGVPEGEGRNRHHD